MQPGPGTSSPCCYLSASECWAASTPDTPATRGDLARFTGEAGDAAGARDQYAALLPVQERVLGLEHPEPQAAREKLAYRTDEADGDVSRSVK